MPLEKIISRIQHFYDFLITRKLAAETCALTETEVGDRCTCLAQARVCEELLQEFNKMFDNFLYSE